MIFILILQTYGCEITGYLFTPKLYPAENVQITYNQDICYSEQNGYFKLQTINNSGLLTFNIANQFEMSKLIQNQCNVELGNIILNNYQTIETNITGCILDENNQTTQAQLTAIYNQPVLLDIQTINVNECFILNDTIMKLMIVNVNITIEKQGYLTNSFSIQLFDEYKYTQNIQLIPNYFTIFLIINSKINTLISLSCGILYKYQQIMQNENIIIKLDQWFKNQINYTCAILGQHPQYGVDYFVFKINQSSNITINLQLQQYQQESLIIGQIINELQQPMNGIDVIINTIQLQQTIQTNSNGNYTIYLQLKEITKIQLTILCKGYQTEIFTFISPQPPFTYYVKQIQLQKYQKEILLNFSLNGMVLTQFNDPINNAQILLKNKNNIIKQIQSNYDGSFVFNISFIGNQNEIQLEIQHSQFYTQLFQLNELNCNNLDNQIKCIQQKLIIQTKNLTLQILMQFDKKINKSIQFWLDKAYYNQNNFANPQLNNSLNFQQKIIVDNKDQININFTAYDYYIYQIGAFIEQYNEILIKNSTNTIVNFGIIAEKAQLTLSPYYTKFIGKILNINNNQPVEGVEIKFYMSFINQQYINNTFTNQQGFFNLIAHNPKIDGLYNGIFIFNKQNYILNEVDISYQTIQQNQEFVIGTIKIIGLF